MDQELDNFIGIQRELSDKRVQEIARYVGTLDATFPTSVIIAVPGRCATIDRTSEKTGTMLLHNIIAPGDGGPPVNFAEIGRVIDGQHRIKSLREGKPKGFELNVTIFVEADIADQAMIFATVNLAQTKVHKSLVYELFSYTINRSPQKSCHEIVVALNRTEDSPFYHRIKRLGRATENRVGELITQSTVVNMLLRYITDDPAKDQDMIKRGKNFPRIKGKEEDKLIFQNMFINNEDAKIARIVWNFFSAISETWPESWTSTARGNMLNRTNGFRGMARVLCPAYLNLRGAPGEGVSKDRFKALLQESNRQDGSFDNDTFKPGTSGETLLYNIMKSELNISDYNEYTRDH